MEYYILGLLVACCLGILPANIAKRKGKDFTTWWVYGTLLWIVAIFHAITYLKANFKSGLKTM